ncbi:MAG: peptide chain release factor 2 [Gammaproteobacteria bacterium]|nr:peptide chain release factor 2 [Gammaproteobacteria bacterium]MDA9079194.1 peptide chain release factor 2 [Gammaproteobacteria bacterium]MDA9142824.1 peptide chain release factor 2 [Gammaproteobacteria bacterium]MDA9259196.1 peptide chain release factor 2 [Gammaproteobacteria bacterium]MDA9274035.1 peptide chain release factor 2 [Gammaproteobacteria bacterium]
METGELKSNLLNLRDRMTDLRGGIFDVSAKEDSLKAIHAQLAEEATWSNLELSQSLNKEKTELEKFLTNFLSVDVAVNDNLELLDMAIEESDEASINQMLEETNSLMSLVEDLEFNRMFSNKMDPSSAFIDIQSGSGGTEAQDWADMLLRMYTRWAEKHDFSVSVIEHSPGEVAGIKSASLLIKGSYAYGWLRTETGVHRLVRKSPFDSGSRRHTSFASVFISPEIDESIEVELNPSDVRIDTYRASGAGGQHVNKTDSAVRLTHAPTGTVVQCQSDRSQHKNKDNAFKQLKSKLYELELQKQKDEQQLLEESKSDIGWGSQIRSYVLDQSRIKDLRTNVESGNISAILDGDIDIFIKASLTQGV